MNGRSSTCRSILYDTYTQTKGGREGVTRGIKGSRAGGGGRDHRSESSVNLAWRRNRDKVWWKASISSDECERASGWHARRKRAPQGGGGLQSSACSESWMAVWASQSWVPPYLSLFLLLHCSFLVWTGSARLRDPTPPSLPSLRVSDSALVLCCCCSQFSTSLIFIDVLWLLFLPRFCRSAPPDPRFRVRCGFGGIRFLS